MKKKIIIIGGGIGGLTCATSLAETGNFDISIYESDIIALCIHNGCDARGGLTDYKFFKVDYDTFLNWTPEYYEEEAA